MPCDASVPESGRDTPIVMVPLLLLVPPPPPPHANATNTANVRTTSPLARTIRFPLVLAREASKSHSSASPHPPPSSPPCGRGESAPTTSAATWGGRTTTPVGTIPCATQSSSSEVTQARRNGRAAHRQ